MRKLTLSLICFISLALMTGCEPETEFTVLIKMMPIQENHFRTNVIPVFEERYKCRINVINFEDMWQISSLIKKYGAVGLVKTPFEITRELAGKGDIKPLNEFLTAEEISGVKDEYFLMALGTIDEEIYFMPRKFECRMLVYLKSKVLDAVNHWVEYKDTLSQILSEYNGYGLPFRYELESDPNQWDFYDVYVAGFYWSNTTYNGRRAPRVAHRAQRYPGTALRLVDRIYQMGGDPNHVLAMCTDEVLDVFEWEALYVKDKIYTPRMWKESWTGGGVWDGFKSNDVFLSFMTQIDCFFIHGNGTEEMPGYLNDPDDMGVAVMPKGVSLDLDYHGNYARDGKRAITTGGWWWGIPKATPSPKLSYELAKHITNTENQIDGCSNYGMVPVRKDILGDISLMFGGGWVTNVFNTAFAQLVENRYTTIPLTTKYSEVGKNYIEAWYDLCVGQSCVVNGKLDRNIIRSALEQKYIPEQKKILSLEYPADLKLAKPKRKVLRPTIKEPPKDPEAEKKAARKRAREASKKRVAERKKTEKAKLKQNAASTKDTTGKQAKEAESKSEEKKLDQSKKGETTSEKPKSEAKKGTEVEKPKEKEDKASPKPAKDEEKESKKKEETKKQEKTKDGAKDKKTEKEPPPRDEAKSEEAKVEPEKASADEAKEEEE